MIGSLWKWSCGKGFITILHGRLPHNIGNSSVSCTVAGLCRSSSRRPIFSLYLCPSYGSMSGRGASHHQDTSQCDPLWPDTIFRGLRRVKGSCQVHSVSYQMDIKGCFPEASVAGAFLHIFMQRTDVRHASSCTDTPSVHLCGVLWSWS